LDDPEDTVVEKCFQQYSSEPELYSVMHPHDFQFIIRHTGVDNLSQQPDSDNQNNEPGKLPGSKFINIYARDPEY
jgi:hypothetical protein